MVDKVQTSQARVEQAGVDKVQTSQARIKQEGVSLVLTARGDVKQFGVEKVMTVRAEITREHDDFDQRQRAVAPIAIEELDITLDVSNDSDNVTQNFTANGEVQQIVFKTPAMNGTSPTAEFKILGPKGSEWYASGEKAEEAAHFLTSDLPPALAGRMTAEVEASETQTADRNYKVLIYLK